MRAMVLKKTGPIGEKSLELEDLPVPEPGSKQILVKISACGICHTELDEIRPTTRNKLRQVLFKMLYEAGLLTANNIINTIILTPKLIDLLVRTNRRDLLYFPIFESDLKRIAQ